MYEGKGKLVLLICITTVLGFGQNTHNQGRVIDQRIKVQQERIKEIALSGEKRAIEIEDFFDRNIEILLKDAEKMALRIAPADRQLWSVFFDIQAEELFFDTYVSKNYQSYLHNKNTRLLRETLIWRHYLSKTGELLIDPQTTKLLREMSQNTENPSVLRKKARKLARISDIIGEQSQRLIINRESEIKKLWQWQQKQTQTAKNTIEALQLRNEAGPIVQAIWYGRNEKKVMIDGEILSQGEYTDSLKVKRIDRYSVVLSENGNETTVCLLDY
jgi:hypothetical protein